MRKKSQRSNSMLGLVNRRFINPDGSAIPLRIVLRDYVEAEDAFREKKGQWVAVHNLLEKKAREGGVDFNGALLTELRADRAAYRRMRMILIRNREIEADEEDSREMVDGLSEGKYGDFWKIAKALDFDARKISDGLHVLYPHLVLDADAAYHIVTRLVTGRVQVTVSDWSSDPLADLKELARLIEPSRLLKEDTLFRLCVDGAEEKYLPLFISDPARAFGRLRADLDGEQNESVRMILSTVLEYYLKVDALRVRGAVRHLNDRETGAALQFPSMHQKAGVQRILDTGRLMIADEMGVGKTAQALLGFVELCNREPERNHKALIICPAGLVQHWKNEVSRCLTPEYARTFEPAAVQSHNKEAALREAKDARIVIISYDMIIRTFNGDSPGGVRKLSGDSDALAMAPAEARAILDELSSMGFSYVAIDEVHRAKNPNYASRAALVASSYLQQRKRERMLITCEPDDVASWAEELSAYCAYAPDPPRILAVTNGSLSGMGNADIVVAPKEASEKILRRVKFKQDNIYDEGEIDEYSACQRSAAVHKLVASPDRGGAEYVVLLTGTPLPNKIEDIGNIAAMLEPENYPSAVVFNEQAAQNPGIIRELLIRRMIRRRVHQVMELPPLETASEVVPLPPAQMEIYRQVQENMFNAGIGLKLLWTRMASLNPPLLADSMEDAVARGKLKPSPEVAALIEAARRCPSAKFEAARRMVKAEAEAGRKTVLFSSVLRNGVIDPLVNMLRMDGISAVHIDGGVATGRDGGEREQVRLSFQSRDGPEALVAMLKTMSEGISLTSASTVIYLDYPYTDAEAKQGRSRVWRRGQRNPVRTIFLRSPETLDENAEALIAEKERIARMLIDGIPLTEAEKRIYEQRRAENSGPFAEALLTPKQLLRQHYHAMHGRGAESNRAYLLHQGGRNAASIANLYLFRWDASFPANAGRAVAALARAIEGRRGSDFADIADLGSGPATFTRITGRPSVCVDMNPHMLELARRDFGGLITTHEELLEDLSLESESYDLAVLSLVLHYARPLPLPGEGPGERERIMREALRILRPGGWLILGEMPMFMNDEGIAKLRDGLGLLGCDAAGGISGIVRDAAGGDFRAFLLAMQKVSAPAAAIPGDSFVLNTEHDIRNLPKQRGRKKRAVSDPRDGRKAERFAFVEAFASPLRELFESPARQAPERRRRKGGRARKKPEVPPEERHEKLVDRKLEQLAELEESGAREIAEDMLDGLISFDEHRRKQLSRKPPEIPDDLKKRGVI